MPVISPESRTYLGSCWRIFHYFWRFAFAVYAIFGGIAAIITRGPLNLSPRVMRASRSASHLIGTCSLGICFSPTIFRWPMSRPNSNRTAFSLFTNFSHVVRPGRFAPVLELLLSIYVFSALFTYRGKHPELMPYVGVSWQAFRFSF